MERFLIVEISIVEKDVNERVEICDTFFLFFDLLCLKIDVKVKVLKKYIFEILYKILNLDYTRE